MHLEAQVHFPSTGQQGQSPAARLTATAEIGYKASQAGDTHISSLGLCESPKCFRSAIFPGRFPILDKRV